MRADKGPTATRGRAVPRDAFVRVFTSKGRAVTGGGEPAERSRGRAKGPASGRGRGSGWSVIYSESRLAIVSPRACSSGFGSGREGWLPPATRSLLASRNRRQVEAETEATHDLRITRLPARTGI